MGETLIFKATKSRDKDLVRLLIDYGVDVGRVNRHGYTCLHFACKICGIGIVQDLLDHGANPMAGTYWQPNRDALAAAVSDNRHEIIECLLNHPSFNWQYVIHSSQWMNILHFVAEFANSKTMEILEAVRWTTANIGQSLNGMDNQGWTPYRMINWRRYNNTVWAQGTSNKPDDDPEGVFQSFMKLVQKLLADHYEFEEHPYQSHRVLVPRLGGRFLDVVEENQPKLAIDAASELSPLGGLQNADEDIEEDEAWEDAAETWQHDSQSEEQAHGTISPCRLKLEACC
ncbi:MAG: hypothetical protein Q9221_007395 [Calogaya cf. arnoldii]